MHNPELEVDAEVAVKCPRCGYIDPEALLGGLQGESGLRGECEQCGGPIEYPRDGIDVPEPDYEYQAHGDGLDEPPGDVW